MTYTKEGSVAFPRYFTRSGEDVYRTFNWKEVYIDSEIQSSVEVPEFWTTESARILATRYCYRFGQEGGEYSLRQVIDRMVAEWIDAARSASIFEQTEDEFAFADELRYVLCSGQAAPNSPQWFNSGLGLAYGVRQSSSGFYSIDQNSGKAVAEPDSSKRPQTAACFIFSVKDELLGEGGIMDLFHREARAFKFGSGVGSNVSDLRAAGESLSGGGSSSGLMSFLRLDDQLAGVMRSGGAHRRAARMLCLDANHPEVLSFIRWKREEEYKAMALVRAGYSGGPDGEAVRSVSGQNANVSVRLNDAFMEALKSGGDWELTPRLEGLNAESIPAKKLFDELVDSAWSCGDPGVQFDTTINTWNPCPQSGQIRASNPCAEFLFLDDSACNLASVNLERFLNEAGQFDVGGFQHVCRLLTIVLDLTIDFSRYPAKQVAQNTADFRPVGLGFCGLGGMLMSCGIPYDSDRGRGLAAAITSLMQATALATSANLAAKRGAFPAYKLNAAELMSLVSKQRSLISFREIHEDGELSVLHRALESAPAGLINAARKQFDHAIELGKMYGFRNALLTAIAPTGTIGLLMGADTGGIEPHYAHVKQRWFSDSATPLRQIGKSISRGLQNLGYNQELILQIETELLAGKPWVNPARLDSRHIPVFAVAAADEDSPFAIRPHAQLEMMAVVQVFIGGGISKTLNLPHTASRETISSCILEAWRLGLKSIAFYRAGSKVFEPVSVADDTSCATC
ncbi:MAG: adenosylcobalamin-dependent ribonucleoside-diphosphate reductase [Sphingobacteriales bacterium]|nr:adenosylcobalamin-dependent ribonucleoside-diphosphate reductase [Sphingobacteriales bacterium]